MPIIDILQDAADLIGLPRPVSISDQSTTTRQLVAVAKIVGDEMARRHDWRTLRTQGVIQGNGTATQFSLAPDFRKLASGVALWRSGSQFWPVIGPASDQEWTQITSSALNAIEYVFRLDGSTIQFTPAIANGDEVRFEYYSSHWISASDGLTLRNRWQLDNDFARMPENVLTLGVVSSFKARKGMDNSVEAADYKRELAMATFADRAPQPKSTARPVDLMDGPVIPDTIRF
jgi:hypothetical protein